jgi:hypothetical protein
MDGGGIAYGVQDRGCSIPDRGEKFFFFFTLKVPPVQWVTRVLSFWIKQPGREADHSSRAEVKNARSNTSTAPCKPLCLVIIMLPRGQTEEVFLLLKYHHEED